MLLGEETPNQEIAIVPQNRVVNGEVLDVTKFLPDHPGGELAILTFAGKDASEEFNMIHPPDIVGK